MLPVLYSLTLFSGAVPLPPGAAVAVAQDDDSESDASGGEAGLGESDSRSQREEKKSLPLVVKLHQQPGVGQKKNYDPNRCL